MAIACWFYSLRPLLLMWARPRQVAWFLISLVLHLAVKFALTGASFIPYALPVDAGPVLLPLALRFFGPAAVWSATLASVVFDLVLQVPATVVVMRAAGWWVAGAALLRLLGSIPPGAGGVSPPAQGRVWLACVLAATAQAGWGALGIEFTGWYSLGYAWFLGALNHLVMITVFGMALYRLLYPGMNDRFGDWTTHFPRDPGVREPVVPVIALFLTGGTGAMIAAWILNSAVYGISSFRPSILGLSAGVWSVVLGVLALALQCAALLLPSWRERTPAQSATSVLGAPSMTWQGILKR